MEMQIDTEMGGRERRFPSTIWSDILALADTESPGYSERMDRLIRVYWKPVYAYVRVAWQRSVEDSKDLTQAFLTRVLEKKYISHLQAGRGSFRAYLKLALKHFLIDCRRSDDARRPDGPLISLDVIAEDDRNSPACTAVTSPDEAYDRQWVDCLLGEAVNALKLELESEGKTAYFQVFSLYCLPTEGLKFPEEGSSGPTYDEVAARLGLQKSDVRNYLFYCRRRLKETVQDRIRDYVIDEEEAGRELRDLLGR